MSAVTSDTQTFNIDPTHTSAEFIAKHMVISKVRGRFSGIGGTITLAGSDVPTAIDVEIDATSIDTREAQRDGHLKSPDFLDTDTHPKISFKSTSVTGAGPSFEVTGDLTIHGITKPVTLKATVDGRTTDPWGMDRVAYSAEGEIDRRDFGLTFSSTLETGGLLVGNEIKMEFTVQAVRKP